MISDISRLEASSPHLRGSSRRLQSVYSLIRMACRLNGVVLDKKASRTETVIRSGKSFCTGVF